MAQAPAPTPLELPSPHLPPRALLEFAIYGPDLVVLERFYRELFGLQLIARAEQRLVALRCGHSTLLLFDPAVTRHPGPIPHHGAVGAGHLAFIIENEERAGWLERLRQFGVEVEREIEWEDGGSSIYFRDPAGNSVELAPPTIWGGLGRRLLDTMNADGQPGATNP